MHPSAQILNRWLVEHPRHGNEWLNFPGLQVYVRRTRRHLDGAVRETLDLASVEAKKQGQGTFREFLPHFEHVAKFHGLFVYVENVQTPRFASFFERSGYTKRGNEFPVCFYKPTLSL